MESAKRKSPSAGWDWTLVLIAALLWPAVALGAGASEVFQKVKDAIVVVKALDREGQEVSQGSGVVLPSGEVVTNHHVVEKGVTVTVVAKGRSALALIVGQDPDRDLALLFVVGLDASPAQLGRTEGLKVGQRVFAVGAPYGLELSISEGIVSQLRGKKPPIIQTTAAISPGSSGGGLFNEQGQLVGITSFYLKGGQGLNFAVPVEWVRELIAQSKKAGPPPGAKAPGRAQAPDSSREPRKGESDTTWSREADALQAAQNWSGLLEHSKRWTRAEPGESLAWYALGTAYYKLGRKQEALSACKEAVRLKPDFAEAWYNLGVAYSDQGRYQEAIQAYKEALRLKPDYAEAWYNLGVAYSYQGRYQEAIQAYKEALRLKPDYAEAWYNLGVAYSDQGRYQEAVDAYKEALRLKPDDAEAWNNLGGAHTLQGRYQEAIQAYKEALRLKPDLAEAWYNLGNAYSDQGRYQEAIQAHREALRLEPDDAAAWNNLGLAYWALGNRSEALKAVKELRRYDPARADRLFNLMMGK
jgi:tetratricopeptide (TPR) repeat protein